MLFGTTDSLPKQAKQAAQTNDLMADLMGTTDSAIVSSNDPKDEAIVVDDAIVTEEETKMDEAIITTMASQKK